MSDENKFPEIVVFAGPNGSGKTTIKEGVVLNIPYVNADDIQRERNCTNLEAAELADELRGFYLEEGGDFAFETVLLTDRKLQFLQKAKERGYFIKCFYVLTSDPMINVSRVLSRVEAGGHDVPPDVVIRRYHSALALIPRLIDLCDIVHIYDNTTTLFRIYKKRKDKIFIWPNEFWDEHAIKTLVEQKTE